MKVVTVVGARPQFIKAAAVSRVIRKYVTEILIHTGQHYDNRMSEVFFNELDIPRPDYNLAVGSGSHAKQTAEMLVKLEEIYLQEKPDFALVYGDTNSTLAAALAASKILIPVIHVEAGLRSFNRRMPEEQNRVLTDHISSFLLCPTRAAVEHLREENITQNVFQIGDVMCDAVHFYLKKVEKLPRGCFMEKLSFLFQWDKPLENWYIATLHRAENTGDENVLREVLKAFEKLEFPVLFPVHPRIRKYIEGLMEKEGYHNICFVEPLGYLEMLFFVSNAVKVITDSGGLQKEAYIMHRNVITLREQTEWVETLKGNHNILCKIDCESILEGTRRLDIENDFDDCLYGNGDAAVRMCEILFKK
ncbi:MAG: UDP-N-acetylglucosamine 2-epimerase (non-hydrolyzing) [Ruminococcus flavefaciens]|nr:UDP-N-acetylglucosamine 2-epimerase (non-hydrolyzing) [Ruminococcus flavefaciens]